MPKYNNLFAQPEFAEAHERMQTLAINLKQEFNLEALFDEVIYGQGITLSPAAQLLLIAPLVEAIAFQRHWQAQGVQDTALKIDTETIRQSLQRLVADAKESPARADRFPDELTMESTDGSHWSMRSAFSIIKSYWDNFCNIPPFCGETE